MAWWLEVVKTSSDVVNSDIAKWAFNRFMVTFCSKQYKKYLTNKLVLEWTAEIDARKQIA